jgi:hypothetical protein
MFECDGIDINYDLKEADLNDWFYVQASGKADKTEETYWQISQKSKELKVSSGAG